MNFSKFAFWVSEIMLFFNFHYLSIKDCRFCIFCWKYGFSHCDFYIPNNKFGNIHVRDFFNPIKIKLVTSKSSR